MDITNVQFAKPMHCLVVMGTLLKQEKQEKLYSFQSQISNIKILD